MSREDSVEIKSTQSYLALKVVIGALACIAFLVVILSILWNAGYIQLANKVSTEPEEFIDRSADSERLQLPDKPVVLKPLAKKEKQINAELREKETEEESPVSLGLPPVQPVLEVEPEPVPEEIPVTETDEYKALQEQLSELRKLIETKPEEPPSIEVIEMPEFINPEEPEVPQAVYQPEVIQPELRERYVEEPPKPPTADEIKAGRVSSGGFGGISSSNSNNGSSANKKISATSDESEVVPGTPNRDNSLDLRKTSIGTAFAGKLKNPDYTVPAGTFIPCNLITKIISDLPGLIKCQVASNVYSATGEIVLIDKGSEVLGEYTSGQLQNGLSRIFVIWSRLRTPENVIVDIDSPSGGNLGEAGVGGHVDRHYWRKFGGAVMVSLLLDGVNAASANSSAEVAEEGINTINNSLNSVLSGIINIQPTLVKNQGERINIILAKDVNFKGVYRLVDR